MTCPDDFKSRRKITLWDLLDPLLRAVLALLALSAVLLVCIFIGLLGFIARS